MMTGLGDLLLAPSAFMLDVGVGVGAMAVAYCEAFPGLRVVGVDTFPRALELARVTIDEAGMADRIEVRRQDVAALEERDVFCLGWLPAPFIPRAAIDAGLPRMVSALVPGGWLVVGHGKFGDRGLSNALTRLQTVAFGGTALNGDEAQDLLRGVGLQQVASLPTPEGAPGITVGRRAVGA
jgi:trans-aconitate methyltransferase